MSRRRLLWCCCPKPVKTCCYYYCILVAASWSLLFSFVLLAEFTDLEGQYYYSHHHDFVVRPNPDVPLRSGARLLSSARRTEQSFELINQMINQEINQRFNNQTNLQQKELQKQKQKRDLIMDNSKTATIKKIPEWEQTTIHDVNYSTTNLGRKTKKGKWKSKRKHREIPPLFMDRLNHYLPACPIIDKPPLNLTTNNFTSCDNNIRLFPKDVEKIEKKILLFNIPRKIVIVFNEESEYVSLIHWRWSQLVDTINQTLGTRNMCPNCHVRFDDKGGRFVKPNLKKEPAHVRMYTGCGAYRKGRMENGTETGARDFPDQILIGECGESQIGSGFGYWYEGIDNFDYDMSYLDEGSPFVRTYAFLHLSPDKVYQQSDGLRPLHNVTDFVKQLLQTPVPSFPRHVNNQAVRDRLHRANQSTTFLEQASMNYDASFIHGNCGGTPRGQVMRRMIDSNETNVTIACYGKCHHNVDEEQVMGGGWDETTEENLIHSDREGHRDASKTILASHHKFGFALENTLSPDYFTEKRWQVLLGASVPVVWNNHNSFQFLPDPDAALLVPKNHPSGSMEQLAIDIGNEIHYYAQPENEQEYLDRFFAWKYRGLRPDFVRKLFLSTDFVLCRICEYMAHHHFYEDG